MSKYSQAMGQRTRAKIVELCRNGTTAPELSAALGINSNQVRKQCVLLKDEGWIDYKFVRGENNIYTTIREGEYEVIDYAFQAKVKEEVNPFARVFKMEDFKHRKYELRKIRHSGIGSSFSMMEAM
jgi:predicted ArsR family transcriptional regulator